MIPCSRPDLDQATKQLAIDCIEAGFISSQGPRVAEFEQAFAAWIGVKEAVAVSNGTSALHLSLLALGIGPGDEVIVPNLTFAASVNAVVHAGATPVLADVRREDWLLDPESVKTFINQKTKAIMPVHLYGQVCDQSWFTDLASKHDLKIIEDAAEAHGARHADGRHVGATGDIGSFSFFANKVITTGEGGMVTTHDSTWAARCRKFRDHGMDRSRFYWHDEIGYNYRMTNVQAAIGLGQLRAVDNALLRRQEIENIYSQHLSGLPLTWAKPYKGTQKINWLTTFMTESSESRDQLLQYLRGQDIDARPGFTALSDMPPLKKFARQNLPVSRELAGRLISLPTFISLADKDIRAICRQIRTYFDRRGL